jgi:hypothetical protein
MPMMEVPDAILEAILASEVAQFEVLLSWRTHGSWSSVARGEGVCAETVVLIRPIIGAPWGRGMVCRLGNHRERAEDFVIRYNQGLTNGKAKSG